MEKFIGEELTREKLFYEKCDTGDMESVKNFAKAVQARFAAIHVLINNGESSKSVAMESSTECLY